MGYRFFNVGFSLKIFLWSVTRGGGGKAPSAQSVQNFPKHIVVKVLQKFFSYAISLKEFDL